MMSSHAVFAAAPNARDDQFTTPQDTAIRISLAEMFQNDLDADGDAFTLLLIDDWENGIASLDREDQAVVFTPQPGFVGQGRFTYIIDDGSGMGWDGSYGFAVVIIEIGGDAGSGDPDPTNTPPTGVDDRLETRQNIELLIRVSTLLGNDIDPDGDTLSLVTVEDLSHGSVDFDPNSDVFTFTPPIDYLGLITFTYTVTDGHDGGDSGRMGFATVTIDVVSPSDPPGGEPLDEVRFYNFGHSLFNHGEQNTGYWLGALAAGSGTISAGNGQFGQLSYHGIPPTPQLGYATNAYEPWPEYPPVDFASRDYTHTLFMPSNFEQEVLTPEDYLTDTFRVLDYVEAQEPETEIILYMHWPEPSMIGLGVLNGNELGRADWTTLNNYTRSGNYYDWHRDYQNLLQAARPAYRLRTIPVGPIIADIIETQPFMQDVSFADLYVDEAPHGSPTVYFLAGMICYRALFLQNPSLDYQPPRPDIIPAVADHYTELVLYIERRLDEYNAMSNGLNVYD
ncbi:cadherin-like domain-containing protein [Sulfidibacter corallicola]|uniref:Cadherin-like domain-containing protein n=2 Tax=Sulfidibacter corallicola TaxID=2818388 RepID=A0A8A4TIS1_SULCO|nr:cadherin-like domain-containing protein [Sulfidibacter corallicola]